MLDIKLSTLTMSNSVNEIIWERLYEEALAKGMKRVAAIHYANDEFNKQPQP